MSAQPNLDERLSFMKLDAEARQNIRDIKPIIVDALPGALESFYGQVRSFPETRRFFAGESQISSAKNLQVKHWDTISSGRFDEDYVAAITAVGEVHARIGLEPRWYIGGYALVAETLIAKVLEARWPKGGFGAKGPPAKKVGAELGAMVKATMLDMDFAISVYLAAAEEARKRSEAEVLARERSAVVASVGEAMAALSAGDLTYRMPDNLPADYARLREDFNAAVRQLEQTMVSIAGATGALSGGSQEIAAASDDLSRRTEQQAASLEETAAALDEITATVKRSAEGAKLASGAASTARADAQKSGEVVREAVAAMGEIEQSSSQINQIIGVIDEIAFQTNLLALNAGVEAARAGEAGRGFAVVASEVRALAQRSAEAAKEIKTLIATSSAQVERGVKLVGETGLALTGIVGKVTEIDGLISEIALSSQEQATGLNQVNTAVNQMDQVTQQNAAMVEEATAAAAGLSSESKELERLVGQFRVHGGEGRPGPKAAQPDARTPARNPVAHAQARLRSAFGGGRATAARSDEWEEF
jgi:methyl-accepting chemotaxis protein